MNWGIGHSAGRKSAAKRHRSGAMRLSRHINICVAACVAVIAALIASCSSIDCPLKNTVSASCLFYNSETRAAATVGATLTVTALGADSVLYNRGVNTSSLALPMAYAGQADTLVFHISSTEASRTDTLVLGHTNEAHFESIDCNSVIFHTITSLSLLRGADVSGLTRIDSVALVNPKVNYNEVTNINIFISTAP